MTDTAMLAGLISRLTHLVDRLQAAIIGLELRAPEPVRTWYALGGAWPSLKKWR